MKKPCQIARAQAVRRVRRWAEPKNPTVQLVAPMLEILVLVQHGAGQCSAGAHPDTPFFCTDTLQKNAILAGGAILRRGSVII